MATYKITGERWLRKYTAPEKSPAYNAETDVARIAATLCDVPWQKVSVRQAVTTSHTEAKDESGTSGLDANVANRDSFDAALFCADHSGGTHRAYANAACYRFVFPDSAVSGGNVVDAGGNAVSLSSLAASVTSDPYNALGARVALLTNSTGVIPTECGVCRNGSVHLEGVSPRTTRTINDKNYWYPKTSTATLAPEETLTLKKYLFLFVLMENYATVRGNWIEGCSYIDRTVTLATSAAIRGLADGGTFDLVSPADEALHEFVVLSGGVMPSRASGEMLGTRALTVRQNGSLVVNADGTSGAGATVAMAEEAGAGLNRLYREFLSGNGDTHVAAAWDAAHGARFAVRRSTEPTGAGEIDMDETIPVFRLVSSVLSAPFVRPTSFSPGRIVLEFAALSLPSGARFNVFHAADYLLSVPEDVLRDPSLYDTRNEPKGLVKLGEITSGTRAEFSLPSVAGRYGTIVISGYLAPEDVDLDATTWQGTGDGEFVPDIWITE